MGLLFERDDWHRDFCIELVNLVAEHFPEMTWDTGNTLFYRMHHDIGQYVDARIRADRERTPDTEKRDEEEPKITTGVRDFILSPRDEDFLRMMGELKSEFDRDVLATLPWLTEEYIQARRQNQPDPEVLQRLRAAAALINNAGIPVNGHTMAQPFLHAGKAVMPEDDTNG